MSNILNKLRQGLEPIKKLNEETAKFVNEAMNIMVKSFPSFKTEKISDDTMKAQQSAYRRAVETFNKNSADLDSASKTFANGAPNPSFKRLKLEEQDNLNNIKLHELFFRNVADKQSDIRMDNTAFMRLARDWGTFDNWQFDFRACALAVEEGWVLVCFEPARQKYTNIIIEGNSNGIPVGAIPVLVIDLFGHAWIRDYIQDKIGYIDAMMREINWQVVEARMIAAEASNISQVFMIEPVVASVSVQVNSTTVPINQPPITAIKSSAGV